MPHMKAKDTLEQLAAEYRRLAGEPVSRYPAKSDFLLTRSEPDWSRMAMENAAMETIGPDPEAELAETTKPTTTEEE